MRRIKILNGLLERGGADENHPLAEVCDAVGAVIEAYEAEHEPVRDSSPVQVLEFLLGQHSLKQKDLADIIPPSNLSAVMKGRRQLTVEQIAKIAARFHVSPAVFIREPSFQHGTK